MDLEELRAEFERENPMEEPTPEVEASSEETEPIPTEEAVEAEPTPETPDISSPNELPDVEESTKPKQTPEENKAFAEMRIKMKQMEEQAQAAEKYQKFLSRIAESNGMTPEQIIQNYEQQQLEQQAKEKGVPLEMYQRLQTLENENTQVKKEIQLEKLRNQVDVVKQKYGVDDAEVEKTFNYIGTLGMFDPQTNIPLIPFEEAYKLANLDSLVERKAKEAQQQLLANKKQRQQSATPPHGNSSSSLPDNSLDLSDDDIEKELAKMGLTIR